MNRLQRGWVLTKESWAIVRRDRTLLVFPIVAGISAIFVGIVFIGGGIGLRNTTGSEPVMIVAFVIGAYVLTVVSTFCNVALTSCAARALEGEDTTVAEGFTAAGERFGAVVGWAGIQLIVGGVTMVIEAALREAGGQILAAIVGGLANVAWGVASFFAIPIITLENVGPTAALKRSVSIVKERWGEGVAGTAAIGGLLVLLVFIPGVALVALGIAALPSAGVIGGALIGVGAVIIVVGVVVQSALMSTFRVALYRFATEDKVLGGFDREPMENAFRKRSRRGFAR